MQLSFENFFSHLILYPFEANSKKDKTIALVASIACGIFSLGICHGLCAIIRHFKKRPPNARESQISNFGNSILNSSEKIKVKWDDQTIIKNLIQQGFGSPVDKGGDGRCLFRSISPQITEEDCIVASTIPHIQSLLCSFDEWSSYNLLEQSDLLRRLAMAEESYFFSSLSEDMALDEEGLKWIRELYKDMLAEIEHPLNFRLRETVRNTTDLEKYTYCRNHFSAYKASTSRPTNWAGTSELIALSRVFNRQTMAFGQDFASSKKVRLDQEGNVLPYHNWPCGTNPPIVVFQTNGGGHYQLLPK